MRLLVLVLAFTVVVGALHGHGQNAPPFDLQMLWFDPFTGHDGTLFPVQNGSATVFGYGICLNSLPGDLPIETRSSVVARNCELAYNLTADGNYMMGKITYRGKKYPVEGVATEAEARESFSFALVWEMNDGVDCSGWSDGVVDPVFAPC